jgi:hypothetical protein
MGVWRMKTPPFLDFAISYARYGFAVFPCKPCGKEPITKHGFKDASRDEAQIRKWWTRAPNANIGIATGARSGLIVVDIDSLEGAKLLLKLTERFGALTPTHSVVTGKGRHYYFKLPPGCGPIPSSAEGGLDFRADGGYVIAPPSIHPDGGSYKWDCASPDEMAIAPQWLPAFAGDRDGVLKAASTANGLADPPSALNKRQKDGGGSATSQSSGNQYNSYGIESSRPEPWSERGVARLRSALAAIPAVDRDVWLKVGFALHDLAAADPRWPGRALWDDWSKTYPKKFNPADQDKTWASFGRGYEGPCVTLATVFHLAQTNGWIDSSGAPSSAGAADAPARQSQADILIAIANRRAELFHAPDGTAYADIEVNGHRETWPIRSRGFRKWLCHAFFEATTKAASSEAQQSALGVVEARAQFASVERPVHVRLAGLEGKHYLDLCDPVWRAVEIDAAGWRVIDRAPARFRRAAGMRPLPVPERGGAISELRPFLNLASDGDFVLIVAWLLACLRDRGPYPILAVSGEQGSAKSTACAMVRALIDPYAAPLRSLPREDRDLFIAANNGHLLAFDNISNIPPWLADSLCRISTGGGFQVRELYADKEEVLFDACRPVILNGIEDVVTRPDLADRAIFLNLEAIAEDRRRPEREIWDQFNAALSRILGALLDAVSIGLQRLSSIRLERHPRMADFCLWAVACGDGDLWPPGKFLCTYAGNRDDAVGNMLDADPLVTALRALMAREPSWSGTATELLSRLSLAAGEAVARSRAWPKNARAIAGRLRRLAPSLRKAGFNIDFERGQGPTRDRMIRVSVAPESGTIRPSASSEPSRTMTFQ